MDFDELSKKLRDTIHEIDELIPLMEMYSTVGNEIYAEKFNVFIETRREMEKFLHPKKAWTKAQRIALIPILTVALAYLEADIARLKHLKQN